MGSFVYIIAAFILFIISTILLRLTFRVNEFLKLQQAKLGILVLIAEKLECDKDEVKRIVKGI